MLDIFIHALRFIRWHFSTQTILTLYFIMVWFSMILWCRQMNERGGKRQKLLSASGKKGFIQWYYYFYYYGFQEGKTREFEKDFRFMFWFILLFIQVFFSRRRLSTFHFVYVLLSSNVECSCMRNIILCINEI